MGVIAVDTDQVRAIAQYCVEDAAALREVRGAVDRAWGVGGLPPTVLRLRGECDIPLATVSRIAHELESEADKLRHYADRIDGIESVQWTPPHIVAVLPFDRSKARIRHPEDDKHPDPLWSWITGGAAGAWGAIRGALKKVADLAKRAEEILAHLIAALTKLATGFVRTADTMQRAVTRWVGGNVVDPILHFPQDWDAWMRHDEHRGIMGPLGTAIDWIGSREHDIEVGLGKLLLLDGKQNSFQDILLNAIPVFGEARGAYRLGMAYKGGDFNSMAWEAAGLALPFFGGAALSSFGKGASAVEKGVMTAAGKVAKSVPFFQDLWSHRGDILHDLAKGAGGLYEGAKGWAKDRWGDITRASRKGQDIIERGWDNFLRDVEQLGKNFVSATEGIGRKLQGVVTGAVDMTTFFLTFDPGAYVSAAWRHASIDNIYTFSKPIPGHLSHEQGSSGALKYFDENYDAWHDAIVITKTPDGKYVIYLRGIDPKFKGSLNSVENALMSRTPGVEDSPYERAVLAALDAAGVPRGADVAIIAHSQGGIVGFNLAEDGRLARRVHLTHLLTAGTPVSNDEIRQARDHNPGIQIMALDGLGDEVTKGSVPYEYLVNEPIDPSKHTFLNNPGGHGLISGGYVGEYSRSDGDLDVQNFRASLDRAYFRQDPVEEKVIHFK